MIVKQAFDSEDILGRVTSSFMEKDAGKRTLTHSTLLLVDTDNGDAFRIGRFKDIKELSKALSRHVYIVELMSIYNKLPRAVAENYYDNDIAFKVAVQEIAVVREEP